MANIVLTNTFHVPQSSLKTNNSLRTTSSAQSSNSGQYFTPQTSVQTNKTSADSDSTLTDHNSTDDTDHEDSVKLSTKHVRSNVSTPEIDIQLTSRVEKTKFFPRNSSKNSINTKNKPVRKRDKIRLLFKKKSPPLNSNTSDGDIIEWDNMLVKTLASMQQDAREIIAGLEEIDQPITDNIRSNRSESIITKPRLSFIERQREKIELIKIAQMLYPPNLLTYNVEESPYPYTDIIEPYNFYFLRMIKQLPDENLFIQHKPFRHKKLRYRTQHGLLRMRHDYRKIKRRLYGRPPFRSYQELPSFNVQNYRSRLEKTFLEVRRQINEYERINSSKDNNHRQSITQIIQKLNAIDPTTKAQIEDYRAKIRPIEYVDKTHTKELNSAPYVPPRARYRSDNTKKDDKNDHLIDSRFDPSTFVDLNEQVDDFFGPDIPFWDQSPESRLSASSPPSNCQSDQFILSSKLEDSSSVTKLEPAEAQSDPRTKPRQLNPDMNPTTVKILVSPLENSDCFVTSFRRKRKNLKNTESKPVENKNDDLSKQSNEDNDEYFDCTSLLSQQTESTNRQTSISSYEQDTVEF